MGRRPYKLKRYDRDYNKDTENKTKNKNKRKRSFWQRLDHWLLKQEERTPQDILTVVIIISAIIIVVGMAIALTQ